MPELPEVEVTRLGLAPRLMGRVASRVVARTAALRYPLPADLHDRIVGHPLVDIARRGKYLLFEFDNGHLLVHLGMSGNLRLTDARDAIGKHDHFDIAFGTEVLRLHDPRRFGALVWIDGDPAGHPLLAHLGAEPLSRRFTAADLGARLGGRRLPIKPALMDATIVVGVGNIYASESLHRAGIDPRTAAGSVSTARLEKLVPAIKATLRAAIRAGGSTLRDYYGCDGAAGNFQLRHRVYGRADQPCRSCGSPIRTLRQANRATYFCPRCQR